MNTVASDSTPAVSDASSRKRKRAKDTDSASPALDVFRKTWSVMPLRSRLVLRQQMKTLVRHMPQAISMVCTSYVGTTPLTDSTKHLLVALGDDHELPPEGRLYSMLTLLQCLERTGSSFSSSSSSSNKRS
jgi:hypothetical protein